MDDVRGLLEEGLGECYPKGDPEAKREVVDNVIRLVRLIVGEGPFQGNRDQLVRSVARFSGLYLVVDRSSEPIATVLATFLALSFCDISTAEDHDLLYSQFHECAANLLSQVSAMLTTRGLSSLVTPEDLESVLHLYERIFRRYIDDPLWPTFKFPWTTNEQVRLTHRLKLFLTQLEPLLDEMSLKLQYGGSSQELKEKTMFEISRTAQQLLPEAAFLRKPPYPGVSCQYRGRYGFTAVIEYPLYREGERPKEKFRVMKYFHLGHRLERIVEAERELMTSVMKAAKQPEKHTTPQITRMEKGATNDDAPGSQHVESSPPND